MRKYASRSVITGLIFSALFAAPALAGELVVNGDFEAGNTGFSSNYVSFPPGPEDDFNGNYWITTNPAILCDCFANMQDHTSGTGNMLLLDGAANSASIFWEETLAVVPNSVYTLSFAAANMGNIPGEPDADILAVVNGGAVIETGLLPYANPDHTGYWTVYSQLFNSGDANSITLAFNDATGTHFFNDFAVDDISLTGPSPTDVPEPATWSLLLVAISIAGWSIHGRRRTGNTAI